MDQTSPTLPMRSYPVTRADLVAYAEASGDPNPIHQDPDVARAVGLPDVIAHGMFTLALAARYVDEQAGPGRIRELRAKFIRPVVVPEDGTEVQITGTWRDPRTLALAVTCRGETVLGNPLAVLESPHDVSGLPRSAPPSNRTRRRSRCADVAAGTPSA